MLANWGLFPVGAAPDPRPAIALCEKFWHPFFPLTISIQTPWLEVPKYEDWPQFVAERSWQATPPVSALIFWFGEMNKQRWSPGVSFNGGLQVIGVFTGSVPYQKWNGDILLHELAHIYVDMGHCHSPFCVLSSFASPGYIPLFHRLCSRHQKAIDGKLKQGAFK